MTKKMKKSHSKNDKTNKGAGHKCSVCGISLEVDEACGCMNVNDIVCCGMPMKAKKK